MPYVTLEEFVTVVTGDSIEQAVSEGRCLMQPFGCGEPVELGAGDDPEDQMLYDLSWQMTGLCPECQRDVEDIEDEEQANRSAACQSFVSFMTLWSELERDDDE
ncbi:hypothetical protein [Streptomyces termitum]|uniref:hypothetical protein n=1 Tax=Streptomyces termitum TaxID=67368 RepID=UPI0033A48303